MTIYKSVPFNFPRVLRIEPASQCNLSCSHCPTGTVEMKRGIMREDVFERVMSEIFEHQKNIKVVVLYHGGEPLLNNSFYSMVSRIKSINNDFFIKTVSNGMALTKKHAEDILKSGIDLIEFSLDGESLKESQYVRIHSNTKKIINNIKYLIGLKKTNDLVKPEIVISTTQFLRNKIPTESLSEPIVPHWLKDIFKNEVSEYKPTYALKWPHMGDSGRFDFFKPTNAINRDECDHIINTLTVRSDGAVVPCCYDLTSKLVMGNILEESLIDIWNGNKYSMLRDSIKSKNYISICNSCAVVRPPIFLIPKWKTDEISLKVEKSTI
jgi:radical SAM protein with 4Fe4S-binding SPASM domain